MDGSRRYRQPRGIVWLVAGLVVFVAVVVTTCGFIVNRFAGDIREHRAVGDAYLGALEAGDAAVAYSFVCASVRAEVDGEAFADAVDEGPSPTSHTITGVFVTSGTNPHSTINATVVVGSTQASIVMTLLPDGDSWGVCSVTADAPPAELLTVLAAVWPPVDRPR